MTLAFGPVSQTLPGDSFRFRQGRCVLVKRPTGSVVSLFSFSPAKATWSAAGSAPRGILRGLTNPVTIRLTIGTDSGETTTRARLL